jgi:dsDNA-binding SOS-regulon protein
MKLTLCLYIWLSLFFYTQPNILISGEQRKNADFYLAKAKEYLSQMIDSPECPILKKPIKEFTE